jgi:alkylation response protein AidB-like acyl-CoA dehydrogenase
VDSMKILDESRISIAALSLGIAQVSYDAALGRARSRRQFGRPISKFQLIQQEPTDMLGRTRASRLLTYRAARLMDQKQDVSRAAATRGVDGRGSDDAHQEGWRWQAGF